MALGDELSIEDQAAINTGFDFRDRREVRFIPDSVVKLSWFRLQRLILSFCGFLVRALPVCGLWCV
jgi:hypothetical protein